MELWTADCTHGPAAPGSAGMVGGWLLACVRGWSPTHESHTPVLTLAICSPGPRVPLRANAFLLTLPHLGLIRPHGANITTPPFFPLQAAAIADKCLHSLRASAERNSAADLPSAGSNSNTALGCASGSSSGVAGSTEGGQALQDRGPAAAPHAVHKRGGARPGVDAPDSSSSDGSFTAAFTAVKKQKPAARQPNPPRRRRLRYAE
jgi:hypothetical protein